MQPHSGSQANSSALQALINPGDKIGMSLDAGGHLTMDIIYHSQVNFMGS